MGAGYSGLRQLTTVRPSYLKLDRSLISGIDTDPDRGALVSAMLGYVRQTGGHLVAEGVETEAELRRWPARRQPRAGLLPGPARLRPGRGDRAARASAVHRRDGAALASRLGSTRLSVRRWADGPAAAEERRRRRCAVSMRDAASGSGPCARPLLSSRAPP